MPSPRLLVAVALICGAVGACGQGGSGPCSALTREALDTDYLVHVLGDADVDYDTDPPTSGPHQPNETTGAVDDPLTRPIQVGILEGGHVLVQHLPSLGAREVAELRSLAGEDVVVAPNPDLPEPIVATAWLFKQTCSSLNMQALEDFIAERVGHGPEQ